MWLRSYRTCFGGGCVSAPADVFDVEFASVCDCDVDAIAAWQVWRALRVDVLVQVGQTAVLRMLAAFGCLPESALPELHQLIAEIATDAASSFFRQVGVDPASPSALAPSSADVLQPLVSEQPEGIE